MSYLTYLKHHGILGQKWGVRKKTEQLAKSSGSVKMDLQFFAKRASSRKSLQLPVKEYAHVMSEIRTNITQAEKKLTVFHKPIENYKYTIENHFDDTYRLLGRTRIPQSTTKKLMERINDGK